MSNTAQTSKGAILLRERVPGARARPTPADFAVHCRRLRSGKDLSPGALDQGRLSPLPRELDPGQRETGGADNAGRAPRGVAVPGAGGARARGFEAGLAHLPRDTRAWKEQNFWTSSLMLLCFCDLVTSPSLPIMLESVIVVSVLAAKNVGCYTSISLIWCPRFLVLGDKR
ncbi:hypothetical protein CB1_000797005 [Camelus ferus]|nr:hypothetical protein CB1_000797005 [Camelus ferus]